MKKVAVMLMVVAILSGCKKDNEIKKTEEVIRPVRYITVGKSIENQKRIFPGVIKSSVETGLSFRVSGKIEQINYVARNIVKKGAVIASLDKKDIDIQLQTVKAAVNSAKASVKSSEAGIAQAKAGEKKALEDFTRIRKLFENGSIAKSEYDAAKAEKERTISSVEQAESQLKAAQAQVEAQEKQYEMVQLQLDYTNLISPADGVIAEKKAEVNENVQAGATVFILNSGKGLNVEVNMPETVINDVKIGQNVSVEVDAVKNSILTGKVIEVAKSSIGSSGTFPVKIEITSGIEMLKPGMSAKVIFVNTAKKQERTNVLFIPTTAVNKDYNGKNFVFKINKVENGIGILAKTEISYGEVNERGVEVINGISVGDMIVTSGIDLLIDGQKVKVPVVEVK